MHYGEEAPIRGWCSTGYGKMAKSPDIDVIAKCISPIRIVSFLYPFEKENITIENDRLDFKVTTSLGTVSYKSTSEGGTVYFKNDKFEY